MGVRDRSRRIHELAGAPRQARGAVGDGVRDRSGQADQFFLPGDVMSVVRVTGVVGSGPARRELGTGNWLRLVAVGHFGVANTRRSPWSKDGNPIKSSSSVALRTTRGCSRSRSCTARPNPDPARADRAAAARSDSRARFALDRGHGDRAGRVRIALRGAREARGEEHGGRAADGRPDAEDPFASAIRPCAIDLASLVSRVGSSHGEMPPTSAATPRAVCTTSRMAFCSDENRTASFIAVISPSRRSCGRGQAADQGGVRERPGLLRTAR